MIVVRVRKLVAEAVWQGRYDQINAFEKLLTDGGLTIVKCFLHISKDEQRERLEERLQNPHKQWKLGPADLDDRRHLDAFQQAYDNALTKCNTEHAPWHIVPANRKWYRNLVVARLVRDTLQRLDPHFHPYDQSLITGLE